MLIKAMSFSERLAIDDKQLGISAFKVIYVTKIPIVLRVLFLEQ